MVKAKGAARIVGLAVVLVLLGGADCGPGSGSKNVAEPDRSERIRCLKANEGGLKTSLDADCVTP